MNFFKLIASSITLVTVLSGWNLSCLPSLAQVPETAIKFKHQFNVEGQESLNQRRHFPISQVPPPNATDLGQLLLQQLGECVANNISRNQLQSFEALQAASMQCTVRVIILTPDGKIRRDANLRMKALLAATGTQLPTTSGQGQAAVQILPFEGGKVFAVPVIVGGEARTFLLDTGASNSILSQDIVQQLKMAGIPIPNDILSYFVVGNDCSGLNATLHQLPPVTVDQATVLGMNGMALPRTAIPGNFAGVLGLDFLKSFDIVLDPKQLTLQLLPRSAAVAGGVPLVGNLGVMTTQVYINNQGPFTFLLDTGADLTVISQPLAERLSLSKSSTETVAVQGFCGQETGNKTLFSSVRLQEHEAKNLDGIIIKPEILDVLGVDGIIGQNYLNQYQQHWRFSAPNELGFPETGSLMLKRIDN